MDRPVRPRIADVHCQKIQFSPGDRVLVRVYRTLTVDEERKIRRGINKWAGVDVEVLIYNGTEMEVSVEQRRQGTGGIVT